MKPLIRATLITLIMAGIFFMPAHAMNPFVRDSLTRVDGDPVMVSLDSMSYQLFTRDKNFGNSADLIQSIHQPKEALPHYTPAEMKRRLKMIPAMMSMDYNSEVQAFIDLFVYRKRELVTKLLASAQIYFPMFEAMLDKNQMPEELKYLPVIESALNPQAVSSAGATGLWQLMYGTGQMMGLQATSFYDERRDPVKSTQAGIKYLKQLYDMYGDWQLALAAYNSGPGYVNKAIARSGGIKNFWAIKNLLPAETRSYVPTFLAMVYVMHYHNDYKLVSAEPRRELYAVDTVMVGAKVSLKHIAQTLGMSAEELQFLNPCLKAGIVPFTANGYPLNIPVNYFATFESRKDVIMSDPAFTAQASTNEMYANPAMVRVPKFIWYKVRKSDNMTAIAARYGVSVSEIKDWNHLKANAVWYGQNLKILTFPEVPVYQTLPQAAANPAPQPLAANTTADNGTPDLPVSGQDKAQTGSDGGTTGQAPAVTEDVLYYYQKGNGTDGDVKVPAPDNTRTVPKAATEKPVQSASPAPVSRVQPGIKYYRVQPGDSLWSITQHYPGLTIEKLRSDNKISGQGGLQKGQVLKIMM